MRAVPHDGSIADEDYVEVLDYEKGGGDRRRPQPLRHRHLLVPARARARRRPPLQGAAGDLLDLRRELGRLHGAQRPGARGVEGRDVRQPRRSRELGLVLNADNVQRNVTFMCHCCGCCCNVLRGISRHGYPTPWSPRTTSAEPDVEAVQRLAATAAATARSSVDRVADEQPRFRKFAAGGQTRAVHRAVSAVAVKASAMKLHKREPAGAAPGDPSAGDPAVPGARTLQNSCSTTASLTHASPRLPRRLLRLPPVSAR